MSPRDTAYLEAWVAAHRGVEAYVEPQTMMTETTVVLIAHDGEWTRRRISAPAVAYRLGRKLGIPVYDIQLVGYPQRMRDHNARQKILQRRKTQAEMQQELRRADRPQQS
ncbi:MAG TPA: oxidoreductase [Pseudonocardiaceae bacterium]|nr:oxidoreductase [Pseudonocardiaceae bacterium]